MSIIVVGLNHHTAPVEVLERAAVPSDDLPKALRSLIALEHVVEASVLSTCNRVEVYAHLSRFHAGLGELMMWFSDRLDVAVEDLREVLYTRFDDVAAEHLFAVASGLDSVVVGERQIALQVKTSLKLAREEGTARRVLQKLFNQAIGVSRRVRRETTIERGVSSMVDLGMDAAAGPLGGLADRSVLVLGAGKIGSLAAARLVAEDVDRVLVYNRSPDRGARLAERVEGELVTEEQFLEALTQADLVVCCAGAAGPVIDREMVRTAAAGRAHDRPLVLLDLALPRNVEPSATEVPGVRLVDLEQVRAAAVDAVSAEALAEAREIVEEEVARFRAWGHAVKVEPTIRALREHAEDVRVGEMERLASRLRELDEREREAVEALTRGIVNTLLHDPTVRLKSLADAGGAEHYAMALRELFDLDE